jgi:hypothetical protein
MINPMLMMNLVRERMREAESQADDARRTHPTRRTRRFAAR